MLSITWAFQDNWFKHIDIEERDKPTSAIGLGRQLLIKDVKEPFRDLDEIVANYICPMNDFVTDMMSYKSFFNGDIEEAKPNLLQKHSENPARVPYVVCFDKKFPGYFALIWYIKERTSPYKTEYIQVRPNGFKWREQIFMKPNRYISF